MTTRELIILLLQLPTECLDQHVELRLYDGGSVLLLDTVNTVLPNRLESRVRISGSKP